MLLRVESAQRATRRFRIRSSIRQGRTATLAGWLAGVVLCLLAVTRTGGAARRGRRAPSSQIHHHFLRSVLHRDPRGPPVQPDPPPQRLWPAVRYFNAIVVLKCEPKSRPVALTPSARVPSVALLSCARAF